MSNSLINSQAGIPGQADFRGQAGVSHPAGVPPLFPELFRDDVLRLETRRLWLRWPNVQDAVRLHEVASMEAVARPTATWPHPLPAGEALRRIERARTANEAGSSLVLALTGKSRPDQLIGLIGVGAESAASDVLTLGYLLGVEHQGYGLMTEAVRTLVSAVFRYTDFKLIRGASGVANVASRRVMEKAGFRLVGQRDHAAPARGAPVACDELELAREAWRVRPCLSARTVGVVGDTLVQAVLGDRAA